MTRVIEIECCQECPYFSYGPRTCGEMNDKHCPNSKTSIPSWCPLSTPEQYIGINVNERTEDE